MEEYQKSVEKNQNITSIEDMREFIERYPLFRSKSINVSKHVAIISELSRLTDSCQLMDISELEQEIACYSRRTEHKDELLTRLSNPRIQPADKIRLALLYMIRYEKYTEDGRMIKSKLLENGLSQSEVAEIDCFLEYAGELKRGADLFSKETVFSKVENLFHDPSALGGVKNVYTQHEPVLSNILQSIAKGKIKDQLFPMVSTTQTSSRPTEVIIFIVGGATFEEATKITEFNNASSNMKVLLGGSCVHNSTSFLREIRNFYGR